ncbi:MAG TPA: hypothetical protein VHW44_15300 [Pseudonocardiaceae bacterium]|nr:hypothetical protein [Pseudonocardiaceae bacterium]
MSEQEIRDALRSALADEPPLSFDLPALVDRAERNARRRRAMFGVAAATALIAVVAVAVPVTLGAGRSAGHPAVSSAAAGGSAPRLLTTSSTPPVPREYTAVELSGRAKLLTASVYRAVTTALPQPEDVAVQGWATGQDSGAITAGPGTLSSFVWVSFKDSTVLLRFTVDAPGANLAATPVSQCTLDGMPAPACTIKADPDGSALLVENFAEQGKPLTEQVASVTDYRTDGGTVNVASYVSYPGKGTVLDGGALPPVGSSELITMAVAPELSFGD